MIILSIGFILLILSIGMGLNSLIRKGKLGFMSSSDQEQYRLVSKKTKEERTKEEDDFYLQNQEAYFSLKVASISFKLALLFILIALIIEYFQK